MKYLSLFLLFSLLLIAGCKSSKDSTSQAPQKETEVFEPMDEETDAASETFEEPTVYYERTHCFGTCPVFVFTAESNGQARYEGKNFVDLLGFYEAEASPAQLEAIYKVANDLEYFSLEDVYDEPMVTDLPAAITKVKGKEVLNRYGGPNLKPLYLALDSLILSLDWKKTSGEKD